jgi:hypothetical protein
VNSSSSTCSIYRLERLDTFDTDSHQLYICSDPSERLSFPSSSGIMGL